MNFISRRSFTLAAVTLALAGTALTAAADTLKDIQSRKKVLIAIDLSVPPYGMTDANMQPQGADVDVARAMARDLGVPLEIVQVSGPNRIPFLMTNKADLVISSFSVTAERAKVVAFSAPYSVNQLVVGAAKGVAITKMDDLNGKRVAVVRGNLQDLELTKSAPKGATLVRYEDDATANTALIAGQVDAIATPATTVKTLAEKNPAKNLEVKFVVKMQPLAIGLRKNDAELMKWVNAWVEKNTANGELNKIYTKHMGIGLPDMKKLADEARAIAL
ncbi:MAG TPA: transporter substrate-binding domain-containing protein [Ramlibacter sp.]|uniref:transporter substrate-binding domain-containing protein n=1 Tax=Ramlibacter sp. TaxID=1917967 RepID=UPI002ED3C2C9